jgi:hypothetical protein
MPGWDTPRPIGARLAHGTRYAPLRRLVPRSTSFQVDADVAWLVLMGPQASALDLYRAWDARVGYRIVYVFDTFASNLAAIRALAGAARWDLMITSFHGAVPMLEQATGRRWHAVAQGVKADRFMPAPSNERLIGVSSFGRRHEGVHAAIDRFTEARGLHYEASIAAAIRKGTPSRYLYRQYAWHLRHSFFNVGWPIELTNPGRAEGLSPVTCRWFEAAASASTMIGRPPADPIFAELFGEGAVLPLDPAAREDEIMAALAAIWEKREEHLRAATERRAERLSRWTWEARVREILTLAGLPAT